MLWDSESLCAAHTHVKGWLLSRNENETIGTPVWAVVKGVFSLLRDDDDEPRRQARAIVARATAAGIIKNGATNTKVKALEELLYPRTVSERETHLGLARNT